MKIEYDFARPNQPDDPGVETKQAINQMRYWIVLLVCTVLAAVVTWVISASAYPVLKRSDRVVICGEGK